MTVLSDRYDELRAAGFTRRRAVQWISDEFRLDPGSVQRTLNRAGRSASNDESVSAADSRRPPLRPRRPAAADPLRRDGNPSTKES